MKEILLIAYVIINLWMFYMMYRDKKLAKTHKWRISEKTLILGALAFGGLGMFMGMRVFHHKTKHTLFRIVAPLAAIIQIAVLIYYYM
ncbi:MAG: DUF1294 domain-containing protein [Clostridium sp.]|uniref:DUF1294 domain-containing protein n=1 Tax=Clostridium sp. TaxID=1506 RepID=UPI002A8DC7A3|nr:DUF1294 domain-containing protein [Clostridium sp.]MDY5099368.1 DUF1294 domain-containing protein [Clostridium sp.]